MRFPSFGSISLHENLYETFSSPCLLKLHVLTILFLWIFSVIFDRLADNGRTYQQATAIHLSNYAEDGLRTMVFAYKKVGVSDYEHWSKVFAEAKASIGPEREALLENVTEMIEKGLFLLGAVAVEDRLQKGVCYRSIYMLLKIFFKKKHISCSQSKSGV